MDITGWTQIAILTICMLALASMHPPLDHRINARLEALEARLLKLEAWHTQIQSGIQEFLETEGIR
jgi:hypothetical protein